MSFPSSPLFHQHYSYSDTHHQFLSSSASHQQKNGDGRGETWGSSSSSTLLNSKSRSLDVSDFLWIYAPVCVLCFFFTFLLLTKKLPRFHNSSLRHYLIHYLNVEQVYKTLKGENKQTEADEHKRLEYGHLTFEIFGLILIIYNFLIKYDQTQLPFFVMQIVQFCLFSLHIIVDFILLKKGYVHVVRSTNSALRFAHSSYQCFVFAIDAAGSDDTSTSSSGTTTASIFTATLPIDVFIIALCHYAVEAIYLMCEGLVMNGAQDFCLIVAVTTNSIMNDQPVTGVVAAFGLSSLGIACVSFVCSMIYKLYAVRKTTRRFLKDKKKRKSKKKNLNETNLNEEDHSSSTTSDDDQEEQNVDKKDDGETSSSNSLMIIHGSSSEDFTSSSTSSSASSLYYSSTLSSGLEPIKKPPAVGVFKRFLNAAKLAAQQSSKKQKRS